MNFNDDDDLKAKVLAAKRQQDLDDQQNEMAGLETGRLKRFLPETARSERFDGKSNSKRAEALTRLQLLLQNNLVFAALYSETADVLNDAQTRLDSALDRVRNAIGQTQAELNEKSEHAARLPDGTRVFKDRAGDVRTQDGSRVSDDLAATILWTGSEPSFEDIQVDQSGIERLRKLEGDVLSGQAEIGDMQLRMEGQDDPPKTTDLNGFKDRTNEIVDEFEERLETEIGREASPVVETSVERTADVIVPKI